MKHPRHGDVSEAFLLCGIVFSGPIRTELWGTFLFRTSRSYLHKELQFWACLWLHGHGHAKNMTKQKTGIWVFFFSEIHECFCCVCECFRCVCFLAASGSILTGFWAGNGVTKGSFLCAALNTEKRVSIAPVRADHMFGGPRNSKKRVDFCKCLWNRFAERFFPDLGIIFGTRGTQPKCDNIF